MIMLRFLSRFKQAFRDPPRPLKWPLRALYWSPIVIVANLYAYAPKTITGRSMQPTLNPDSSLWKDVVIFDRISTRVMREYKRGDVVALKDPITHELIVKRIVALAGDIVKTLPPYPDVEIQVPEGHAWVEGDEPFKSGDSNIFGPIPLALIDSKLIFIVWPLSRFGPLSHQLAPPAGQSDLHSGPVAEREGLRGSRVRLTAASMI